MADLFWLTVSEVLIHSGLVPLLLNLWQGKNVCCRKAQQKKAAHFTAARKQRAREEESDNKIYALKT
jgi:hypothetical protein